MASIENYIPVTTGKKKRSTLGEIADGVGNSITGTADAGLGVLGMGDIINEKSYRGDNAGKWDKGAGIVSKVGQVAGSVALTMATAGAGAPALAGTAGAATPSLGAALGGALLSKSFESGGMRNIASEDNELIELQGNTHAQGGINIGNGDEAEGKETIFNSGDSGQFIFSEKLKLPNSKKSFADESKKIEKEYKNNKDSLREKAMKQRIGNLANLQESIKPKEKILGNKFDDGGLRFNLAEAIAFNPKLSKSEPFQFNNNNGLIKGNKIGENIGKQTVDFSKLKATSTEGLQNKEASTGFKNMSALPQIIGYGAQALANIPGLFTKPERVKYDRVTPDLINLGAERDALSQDRNLSRAMSRKLATGSNNVGQALNFLGANESDLSRQFGQNISKSFQTEANLNSEIKNKTRMFNAEISRAEQDANAAEKDAAKSARLQSLSNIGSIAALGAKDFMDMTYKYDQLSALDTGDFVMVRDKNTGKLVQKEKKYNADGTWDGKSFK